MQAKAFFLAIIIYGVFSVPAPRGIAVPELVIGLSLVLAVGVRTCFRVGTGASFLSPRLLCHELVGLLGLHLLLWLPLLVAVYHGWTQADIVRDVGPLLFLFLPVLATLGCRAATRPPQAIIRALDLGLTLAGVALAIRWWYGAEWGFGAIGTRAVDAGPNYLLNAPAVPYAVIRCGTLVLTAGYRFSGGHPWGHLCLFAAACSGFLLSAAALAANVHRVAIGATLLGLAAILASETRFSIRPLATTLVGLCLVVIVIPSDMILGVLGHISAKTEVFGLNGRDRELDAVLAVIATSPCSFLVGEGWGAVFNNPAVGGWAVSYTHNLISYFFLKSGLLGVLAITAYGLCLLAAARPLLSHDPPLAIAGLAAVSGGVLFHTSYKFLDFGLLLTLLTLAGRGAAINPSPCHTVLRKRGPPPPG